MNEEQQIELKNLENLKAQLEELKKSKSSSKLAIAQTTADIGYSCNNLDKYEEALDYYKESLKNYTQYNLADNYQSDIAEIYMCMGTIYDRQGNYSKALNRLQMSLDICSKKQSNDSNRANVLNSMGLVYMNLGKDDEALDYLNESLRIKKRIFDRDSPEIATAYGNIGIVYKKKGELDDALNYLNIALGIKENANPINYTSLAGTLNNIGLVYFNQGKFDDALNYYERSLEIREKRLASNHPEIGRTLVNIGDLYFIDGDYEKALEYFNKSHNIYKNFPLPANHPDIGRVLNKIGHVYKEERNYEEALQFFKDSLDVYQKSELLSDHSDIVETYNIIGLVYKEQGQYEQALKYLKDSGQISACLRQIRKDRKDRDKEDGLADAKKQFKKQAPIEVISDDLLGRTFKERYKTVKILGSGTYGQVYKIHDSKESKIEKVVKITKKDLVAENEIDHLSNINHENIVKYFHSFHMKKSDQVFLCIIIEYCSSDLRKQINNKTKFAEKQIFDWTFQTTKALVYLNSKKIIHRDVKPENMLLSENETIKLSDFGLATLTSNSSFSSSYAGTKSYMSPESYKCVYKDKNNYRYTYNTDIWSLGCVLYELMFLKKAFPQGQSRDPKVPNLGNWLLFTPILELMLVKDPEKRIKSKDLEAKLSDVEKFIEKQLKNKT